MNVWCNEWCNVNEWIIFRHVIYICLVRILYEDEDKR